LLKKFGKLGYAWDEIDGNRDGMLQFHEFVRACRGIHFGGNFKQIFDELTQGEDALTPEAFDPGLLAELKDIRERGLRSMNSTKASSGDPMFERSGSTFRHGRRTSAETLGEVHLLLSRGTSFSLPPPADANSFKNALLKKFGKLGYAWVEMDANGDGNLSFTEFVRACRNIQFGGNFRQIFTDLTRGGELLTPEQFDPHLPSELKAIREQGLMSESPRRAQNLAASAENIAQDFNHGRLTPAQTLGEVHLMLLRPVAPAGPPCDAKSFKNALLKKFGKLTYAWAAIDANGDGELSFGEFVRACRSIQFVGNLRKIYEELCKGGECLHPGDLDKNLPTELERMRQKEPRSPATSPRRRPMG